MQIWENYKSFQAKMYELELNLLPKKVLSTPGLAGNDLIFLLQLIHLCLKTLTVLPDLHKIFSKNCKTFPEHKNLQKFFTANNL